MAKRNRETLKNYFKQGRRPTEQEFEDLIDSTLNTLDDGFSGSSQIGLGLAPLSEQGVIISAFRNPGDSKAIWEIVVNKANADLQIRRCNGGTPQPIATLKYTPEQTVQNQEVVLEGILNSKGRKGSFKTGIVPADGEWHDILNEEDRMEPGCWAFEIVAGCGERHKGKYALTVVTAIQCFGSRPKVHAVQSCFGIWGNRIRFRWQKYKGKYDAKLQVKTHFRYEEGIHIQYQISTLWDNPQMQKGAN